MKKLIALGIAASVVTLSGCSTMFNSGSQTIVATSPDKNVNVDVTTASSTYQTTLPTTIVTNPSSTRDVTIKVNDKCYKNTSVTVHKSVTPSYWANILNGWGFLIDYATGDMWKYDNQVLVPTEKKADCDTVAKNN
ncbi:hypothetical protein [Vibrio marisflavi]|uniref:Uncharacterized protein n=1 Tax=Vibrio marisflavi CECT 7928 TaxID=634439 RepID=A0ABM9A8Y8_9VIBR|nr:hypothetical protein [Vibrio marisflavi]CAH0541966.1 hypothetical protein VMF7928_03981 [Vibrio marisflavi CECT 7928]